MNSNIQAGFSVGKVMKLPSLKENFGLSKADFCRAVDKLKNGDDSFFTNHMVHQLPESMRYLQYRFNLSNEDAYDICMNTFLEFRRKLLAGKITYGNLRYLFTRMCLNNFIDGESEKSKIASAINVFLGTEVEYEPVEEKFFQFLDKAIDLLPEDQKELLQEVYYSGKSLQTIADEQSLSYPNLRKKKERIIRKARALYLKTSNNIDHND